MSAEQTTLTVEDCLRAAFQAALRGNMLERDRLCAMAERAFINQELVLANTPVPFGKEKTQ